MPSTATEEMELATEPAWVRPRRLLFIDTETTGLIDKGRPLTDPCQPWPVEIAAVMMTEDQRRLATFHCYVRPEGWEVPAAAAAIHGLSADWLTLHGISQKRAASALHALAMECDAVVAHNVAFDWDVASVLWIRSAPTGKTLPVLDIEMICTCSMAGQAMGRASGRAPLAMAYERFCGKPAVNTHTALGDVESCIELYFALKANEQASADEEVPF